MWYRASLNAASTDSAPEFVKKTRLAFHQVRTRPVSVQVEPLPSDETKDNLYMNGIFFEEQSLGEKAALKLFLGGVGFGKKFDP